MFSMKLKRLFIIGLVLVLSLVGISSAFAATEYAYVSPSSNVDYTTPVTGQGKYGRYGLEVTKGKVKAILSEQSSDGSWTNVHNFTITTTTKDSKYIDYWMKNGTKYAVTLIAETETELGVGYVKNEI